MQLIDWPALMRLLRTAPAHVPRAVGGVMGMNDRFREAAMWVAAHPGEQVTLTMPKDDLADALADAVEDCRWPWQLRAWVRDLANRTSGMCATCWAASETAERWEEARDEPIPQPRHGDCTDPACTCPHRVRA